MDAIWFFLLGMLLGIGFSVFDIPPEVRAYMAIIALVMSAGTVVYYGAKVMRGK